MPDSTADSVRARRPREVSFDPLPSGPGEPRHNLIPIKASGSTTPVFLVHGGFGHAFTFKRLAEYLRDDIPLYGFEAQGVRDDLGPRTSLPETVCAYVSQMRRVQPEGPYLLGGFSYGAWIAWEMARQLDTAGEDVRLLMIDAGPDSPDLPRPSFPRRMGRIVAYHWKHWRGLEGRGRRSYGTEAFREEVSRISGFFKLDPQGKLYALSLRLGRTPTPGRLPVFRAAIATLKKWEHQPYERPFTLFRAQLQAPVEPERPTLGFTRELATAGFEIRHLPGSHSYMFVEPFVFTFVVEFEAWVDRQLHSLPQRLATSSIVADD